MLVSSVSYALIENYNDPCDERWVEDGKYVHYVLYSGKDLMNPSVKGELTMKDHKMCREDNGGFTAVMYEGTKGYLSTAGQFISWGELQ
jgi:hypothetical protein